MDNVITPDHPSYGFDQAWFLFAMVSDKIERVILVEAKNAWAVQTIERIAVDGMVSSNCQLLAVHRHCPSIGLRSDLIGEISYVDFLIDIIDPNRINADSLTSTAVQNSLSSEERSYAIQKMNAMQNTRCSDDPKHPISGSVSEHANYQDLMAALTGLGFKKNQAKRVLDEMGVRIAYMKMEDSIKEALQKLSRAID
jgi:hypothetical protein